ncbi:DUF3592 domain-containing protein [Chloroflexota bacterium]
MTNITLRHRLLTRWKTIIAILVLLGIGSYFSYAAVSASWHEYSLMQSGETTTGYIIDLWEDVEPMDEGGLHWFYGGTYTYQIPDGRKFTRKLEGDRLLRTEFHPLTQLYPVEVTYLPDNPGLSSISAELSDNTLGIFRRSPFKYILAACVLFIGFYLLWDLIREERIREKEKELEEQRQFEELTQEIIERSRKPS